MSNEYFTKSGYPSTSARAVSASLRSEIANIEAGFDKMPVLAGNGSEIIAVNSGATALEAIATTGTGSGVRATSPTLVTPVLGVATATSINGVVITGTGTIASGAGIAPGTYTPSFVSTFNFATMTAQGAWNYLRVANFVMVTGVFTATFTTDNALSRCAISLPVATTADSVSSISGVASYNAGAAEFASGVIFCVGAGDTTAVLDIYRQTDGGGASTQIGVCFSYRIE